jgi:hypothetical protein
MLNMCVTYCLSWSDFIGYSSGNNKPVVVATPTFDPFVEDKQSNLLVSRTFH